ncbi:MAG: RT0821/Lpp0805 family surface protein [Alphaproteobacteria bacterium]
MKLTRIATVVLLALALTACAEQYGPKQTGGTLVGAGLGALAGSQIGSGGGQLAAVAVGTLLGAFVGSEVGKSLDKADQMYAQQAAQQAQDGQLGQTITWNNPDSGHSGTVTPVRDGYNSGGSYCREFQQTVTIGGKTEEAYGTACQQPDGSWKIVE